MTCRFSTDGKLVVCGARDSKRGYYFTKNFREVLYCDSLWYGPSLVKKLRRKKYERIDLFKARVLKKLGFMPLTHRGWWRVVAAPQIRDMQVAGEGKKPDVPEV